jgi:hypothetical protein
LERIGEFITTPLQDRIEQLYNNYVDQGSVVQMLRCLEVRQEASDVKTFAFEMYASLHDTPCTPANPRVKVKVRVHRPRIEASWHVARIYACGVSTHRPSLRRQEGRSAWNRRMCHVHAGTSPQGISF